MELYLKNDNQNSFQSVMLGLMAHCGYGMLQAEQAAVIAHNKGEYKIKEGDYLKLEEIRDGLESFNLKVDMR